MIPGKLFFDTLKEDRGWYFVEYRPPLPSYRFAMLGLVVPEPAKADDIAAAMETELRHWLGRYPVPIMTSSFDGAGDLFRLSDVRESDHLFGWRDPHTREIRIIWRLVMDDELPSDALDSTFLRSNYSDVGFRTESDLKRNSKHLVRDFRIGWIIVFAWAVIVPAMVAILEWASPSWVAALVLAYSLWQAFVKAMKMLGKWKPSASEIKEEEETRRKRHYAYHCEQNPEGFLRLKLENFERSSREDIRKEAASHKQSPAA